MKKIILAGLLSSFLFGSTYPNYKASLGFNIGDSIISSTSPNFSEKSEQLNYGIYFSMEEKFSNSHFYYGVGFDFDYLKFNVSFIPNDVETSLFALYPSIGYNFTKDFSVKSFIGVNYLDAQTDIDSETWGNNDIGYLYGMSLDYSLGTSVTNGIAYKHNVNKLGISDIESDLLIYKIGIKF